MEQQQGLGVAPAVPLPRAKESTSCPSKEDSPGLTARPDHYRIVQEFVQGIPILAGKNQSQIALILAVAAAKVEAYCD